MKYYSLFILAFTSVLLASCHQKHEGHQDGERQHQHDHDDDHDHQEDHDHHQNSRTSTFDAELAEKLGADEYGMSQYVIAFLKSGPNRSQDSITAAQMQRAHLDNINRL
ncbi:MAG: hypothetical protein KJP00_01240, partial [Bacteroidia bacterium]|nr:hypothetical protein [Bacteroidia bacterium]